MGQTTIFLFPPEYFFENILENPGSIFAQIVKIVRVSMLLFRTDGIPETITPISPASLFDTRAEIHPSSFFYFSSVIIARCFPLASTSVWVRLARLKLAVPAVCGLTVTVPSREVDFTSPSSR